MFDSRGGCKKKFFYFWLKWQRKKKPFLFEVEKKNIPQC